jgi:hypothetical protein
MADPKVVDPTPTPAPPVEAPKQYHVVIPLVITKKLDGSDLYVYEGGVLPSFVKASEVARLLTEQFIAELDGVSTPIAESN